LSPACYSLSSPHHSRWWDKHSVCRQLPIRCRGSRGCCCIRSCPRRQLSSICSEQTCHLCGCRGRRKISPCFHLHSPNILSLLRKYSRLSAFRVSHLLPYSPR